MFTQDVLNKVKSDWTNYASSTSKPTSSYSGSYSVSYKYSGSKYSYSKSNYGYSKSSADQLKASQVVEQDDGDLTTYIWLYAGITLYWVIASNQFNGYVQRNIPEHKRQRPSHFIAEMAEISRNRLQGADASFPQRNFNGSSNNSNSRQNRVEEQIDFRQQPAHQNNGGPPRTKLQEIIAQNRLKKLQEQRRKQQEEEAKLSDEQSFMSVPTSDRD